MTKDQEGKIIAIAKQTNEQINEKDRFQLTISLGVAKQNFIPTISPSKITDEEFSSMSLALNYKTKLCK